MDEFLARTMIETLSKGIHPITGRALSEYDSCSNEIIQDALIEVLAHCNIESTEQYALRIREEKKASHRKKIQENHIRYPRNGEPWTDEEENKLLNLCRKGKNLYQIANILKRSPGAVSDRMKKLQNEHIYRTEKTQYYRKL